MASHGNKENESRTAMKTVVCEPSSESKDDKIYEQPGYFEFPFTPYDIQVKFMQNLYSALESGGVGIFESPTGTVSRLAPAVACSPCI